MSVPTFKAILERKQSKKVLSQWRRYAEDFDKHLTSGSSSSEGSSYESGNEFADLETDEEEDEDGDLFLRTPCSGGPTVPRRRSTLRTEPSRCILKPIPDEPERSPRMSIAPLAWKFDRLLKEKYSKSGSDESILDTDPLTFLIRDISQQQAPSVDQHRRRTHTDSSPSCKSNGKERASVRNQPPVSHAQPRTHRQLSGGSAKSSGSTGSKKSVSNSTRSCPNYRKHNPKTVLKIFPREQRDAPSTNSSALFGTSDTLGRAYSQERFLGHYRDKFKGTHPEIYERPVSENYRTRSDITVITPMSEKRAGSYIFFDSAAIAGRSQRAKSVENKKIYELMRTQAVTTNRRESRMSQGSSIGSVDHTRANSTPSSSVLDLDSEEDLVSEQRTISVLSNPGLPYPANPGRPSTSNPAGHPCPSNRAHLGPSCPSSSHTKSACPAPDCKYLGVSPHTKTGSDSGSLNSEYSSCSDVCLPPTRHISMLTPASEHVAEFRNQYSLEGSEDLTVTEGFTVSKLQRDGSLKQIKFQYDYEVTEPTPDQDIEPDFEHYLEHIYNHEGDCESGRASSGEEEEKGEGDTKEGDESLIDSAVSEESQALMWSNINEMKRVFSNGDNPITWLMNKTPVSSTVAQLFESGDTKSGPPSPGTGNVLTNFFKSQRKAISEGEAEGIPSKWSCE